MVSLVNFKLVGEDLRPYDERCSVRSGSDVSIGPAANGRCTKQCDASDSCVVTNAKMLEDDNSGADAMNVEIRRHPNDRTSVKVPTTRGQVSIKMNAKECTEYYPEKTEPCQPSQDVAKPITDTADDRADDKQQESTNSPITTVTFSSQAELKPLDAGRSTTTGAAGSCCDSCSYRRCNQVALCTPVCGNGLNQSDSANNYQSTATTNTYDDTSQCSLAHEDHHDRKTTTTTTTMTTSGGGSDSGGDNSKLTTATTTTVNSNNNSSSFAVTWRNLKFCIEPKWHEKLANCSPFVALTSRVACSSSSSQSPVMSPTSATSANGIGVPTTVEVAAATTTTKDNDSISAQQYQEQQLHQVPITGIGSRIVLDRMDGSFRSGELTAILGPSGAGKTTLLDCLTGHRKTGLSGSIRISSSVSQAEPTCTCKKADVSSLRLLPNLHNFYSHELVTPAGDNNKKAKKLMTLAPPSLRSPKLTTNAGSGARCDYCCERSVSGGDSAGDGCSVAGDSRKIQILNPSSLSTSQTTMNGDNLKVSIIPQNDHLIGHLTVYETLNYASKMKNCFNRQFDHKLNVKRVAQQLGLASCLATRINKLSGGQYKRVSIAQELLSSPDILILDEPTSGLDAMSCFQTVQVLKELTDERQRQQDQPLHGGQKPIAVILTIHQPNSDVFQQFNHVYVVAQGGKCIYEGPPASIESVINRIGIRLPNSYYNPATMIVEIAAGKFGQEAICKLNAIQKKQYELYAAADEQNSTGDSAVDCPSSSNEDDYDNDDHDSDHDNNGFAVDDYNDDQQQQQYHGKHSVACTCCNNAVGHELKVVAKPKRILNVSRLKLRNAKFGNGNNKSLENQEVNNNSSSGEKDCNKISGLINQGFTMDGGESLADGKNKTFGDDNNNNNSECDGVVVNIANDKLADNNNNENDDNNNINNNNNNNNKMIENSLPDPVGCNNSELQQQQLQQRRNRKRRRTRRRVVGGDSAIMTTGNKDLSGCMGPTKQTNAGVGRLTMLSKRKNCSSLGLLVCGGLGGCGPDGGDGSGSDAGGGGGGPGGRNEKRLKLNSLKADQKFPFWRHTYLHFHRSWLSIVRDPMLCSMQLALHIIVPVMVSLVYGTYVGKPNACPRAGPIDIMAYALEPTDKALQLQEDLRTTLENIGYIFFKLYGIIFAAMTVTVLTFPLDMHVLVKEFRNGWYGLSSYFLGRTLADIPFQLTLPLLAMSLSYYATGQPYSYMQWRFFSITAILILSSLIAQSQGLLFGAILMDRMKAAVFVAPAATTPIILFAGFLVRTQSIPSYLRPLSNLSYLRYAIEACLISRYGFNQCECDPAIFSQTVPELPPIARSMLDYWLSSFKPPSSGAGGGIGGDSDSGLIESIEHNSSIALSSTTTTTTTIAPLEGQDKPDLFTKLIDSLARANSFGRNITSCEQVVPYPMIDYDLKDSQLFSCFAILLAMLIFTRLLTFFIVCYKVKRKV